MAVNVHPVRVKTADGWQELALTGPQGPAGPAGAGVPAPVVNGQWVKGVSGAAVWQPMNFTDVGGIIADAQLPVRLRTGSTAVVTTSPIGSPPASPANGDIWYATGVGTSGDRWAFQYNAAASYKWEFIGGTPLRAYRAPFEGGTTGGAWVDYGGPSVYWPRVGEMLIEFGCTFHIFGETSYAIVLADGSQVTDVLTASTTVAATQTVPGSLTTIGVIWGPATIKMFYQCTQTADWGYRWLKVTPVRIN